VHAEKRGWSLSTGFVGSDQIILTCLKCGYKFKPGQTEVEKEYRLFGSGFVVLLVLGVIVLILASIYAASTTSPLMTADPDRCPRAGTSPQNPPGATP
jgi:hypothetical protein